MNFKLISSPFQVRISIMSYIYAMNRLFSQHDTTLYDITQYYTTWYDDTTQKDTKWNIYFYFFEKNFEKKIFFWFFF